MAVLGVHLRQDWVKHCLQAGRGRSSPAGNGSGGRRQAQEDVYRTFLACDLREAGEACLPAGVGSMAKERVKGKMVVQVKLGFSFLRMLLFESLGLRVHRETTDFLGGEGGQKQEKSPSTVL